jgi:AcrR family transcriptional regulator
VQANATNDPYERRRQAGLASREQTRRRLLRAADDLFRERGYQATTVSAIAERAGVSLQTLYLAWDSKSALFRAAADASATASGMPLTAAVWRDVIRQQLALDVGQDHASSRYLAAVAHIFVGVAERTAVYWRMQPAAAAAEPEIAKGYAEAMRQRRVTMEGVASDVPRSGLRPGLTDAALADTLWALASPETFSQFVTQAGRSPADFETWLTTTLVASLCG